LCWAEPAPAIARAFAGLSLAAEQAGTRFLAEDVRSWARERLKIWNGSDPGLGRAWLTTELHKLQDKHRPAGRLVLLSALAPDQVDKNVVREFRQADSSDAALLGAVAWSSFSAARVIGCWIAPKIESFREPHRPPRAQGVTFPIDRDSSFA
jgi:hypothetical protein